MKKCIWEKSRRSRLFALAISVFAAPLTPAGTFSAHATDKVASAYCRDGRTEVQRATGDELALICLAAGDALDFLRDCGLRLPGDLQIEVANEGIEVGGLEVFGCFDAETDKIRLLDLERCAKAAAVNKAYAALPANQFYKSIVAHEVAHRVFRSNLGNRTIPRAGHEYVAYAVQITQMPETVRRQFLAPIKRSPPSDLRRFADMLLLMAPEAFAAMSYDHFSAPGNGCKLLRDLLMGIRNFPRPEESHWLD